MKSKQKKELKDLKNVEFIEVRPHMTEEEIYQNLLKNLKKQGIKVKVDKKQKK